jgi:hypothetical protein
MPRLEPVVTFNEDHSGDGTPVDLHSIAVMRDLEGRVRVWDEQRDAYGWANLGPVAWD